MKTLNKTTLTFLLSFFLLGGQIAMGQNDVDGKKSKKETQEQSQRKKKRGNEIENLVSNLTADQKKQLTDLASAYKEDTKSLKEELQKESKELEQMKRDPNANTDGVNKKIDEVASLNAKLDKENYAYRKEIKKVLTPEQLKELQAKKRAFRDKSFYDKQQEKMKKTNDKK